MKLQLNRLAQNHWRYFLTAVMFFTRIPISLKNFEETDLNKSSQFFPLIGIIVGIVGALVFWVCDFFLPLQIAVLLSMVATILLTGAFHEDGLADSADGLGGGWSKEQVLTIMLDSRIGTYGAVGLLLALLIKYQAISYQPVSLIPVSMIAGHAISRLCAVLVMFTQCYVKAEGKSKPLATKISTPELFIACFFGFLPMAYIDFKLLAALVPVMIVWLWFSAKIKVRIGGYTGDCLGAMQQITEITFYLGLLASATLFANS